MAGTKNTYRTVTCTDMRNAGVEIVNATVDLGDALAMLHAVRHLARQPFDPEDVERVILRAIDIVTEATEQIRREAEPLQAIA